MGKSTILQKWESYKNKVIPATASSGQIRNSQFAFYAGAITVIDIMIALGEESISTEAGVDTFQALIDEVNDFKNSAVIECPSRADTKH